MNQQKYAYAEPWRGLPASVADVIEPELPGITAELFEAIAREVPEYARPLEGSFGRGLRGGVTEALRQFVALVRDPDAGRGQGRDVYVALGRGELRQGRSLDSLQSAYRVGARVAWRRLGDAGLKAGLDPAVLNLLAESIFAYIDGLSAESVEGYYEARAALAGERERQRSRLVALLGQDPPAEADVVRAAARNAGWRLPRRATMLACAPDDLGRLASRLPSDSVASGLAELGCAVVPDPDGPGRRAELAHAARDLTVAVGPSTELHELGRSWALAAKLLAAVDAGQIAAGEGEGPVRVEDHLMSLALAEESELLNRIGAMRLAPLEKLTTKARLRMRETLFAYLRLHGNVAAMAESLHVHQQTVRYRLAKLRELLGDDLDDPEARFELEAALRAAPP